MPFIGQIGDLGVNKIHLSQEKCAKIACATKYRSPGATYRYQQWQTLIGRLIWLATLKIGMLATFDRSYRNKSCLDRHTKQAQRLRTYVLLVLTECLLQKLADIVAIPQLGHIPVTDGPWATIIAFDSSFATAVVKCTGETAAESKKICLISITR